MDSVGGAAEVRRHVNPGPGIERLRCGETESGKGGIERGLFGLPNKVRPESDHFLHLPGGGTELGIQTGALRNDLEGVAGCGCKGAFDEGREIQRELGG